MTTSLPHMPPALYRDERREPPHRGAAEKLARPSGRRHIYVKYRNIKGDPLWAFAAISGPGHR
jgi:hypothetical protein